MNLGQVSYDSRDYKVVEHTSSATSGNINITIGSIRVREPRKRHGESLGTSRFPSVGETLGEFITIADLDISLTKSGTGGDVVDVLSDMSWNVILLGRYIMDTG